MKHRSPIIIATLAALIFAACGNPAPPVDPNATIAETLRPDEAPQATKAPTKMSKIAGPDGQSSLYVVHLRNQKDLAIAGARTMLLANRPAPEYMREPRRRDVIATYKSPKHGRVHFMATADSQPKYLLITGNGFEPKLVDLKSATPGATDERTVKIEITPICTMLILDHLGYLCDNALVTMKPKPGSKPMRVIGSGNVGKTQRADDSGEVKFTRAVGTYIVTASNSNYKGKVEKTIEWDGNPDPIEVRLKKP